MDVSAKKVWITGASSGIGEEYAYAFARKGCYLVLSGRNNAELERVRNNCAGASGIEILPLDLARQETFAPMTAALLERIGHIDILVNNAGVSQRSMARDTRFDVDKFIIEVDLIGTIGLTKAVLPSMLARRSGQIVVTSSLMGKFGTPMRSAYAAAKHGLHGFFDSLRAELHQDGIRVLIVCPGFIRTNVSINAMTGDGSRQNTMDETTGKGLHPSVVAARMIRALQHDRQEIYVGGSEVWGVYLKRFFPGLFSRIVRKAKVT